MAALTDGRNAKRQDPSMRTYPMDAADQTIYKGGIVHADATGYAVPGADTVSHVFLGVATETVEQTGAAADGENSVKVWTEGFFTFAASGMAITNVGTLVYTVDDQTVGLAATTTNDVPVGTIVDFISATEIVVDISRRS